MSLCKRVLRRVLKEQKSVCVCCARESLRESLRRERVCVCLLCQGVLKRVLKERERVSERVCICEVSLSESLWSP